MADSRFTPVLPQEIRILADDDSCPDLHIVKDGGRAWAVAWPGVGSHLRSLHRISLPAGAATISLEHPMEAVYYVISGSAVALDVDAGSKHSLSTGAMMLIDPGTTYEITGGQAGAEIVGGPCPADPGMYVHLEERS